MIGERLAKLRKARKLTQNQLGMQLHISQYSICMYENNKHMPSKEVIIALAKYFDVSIDYLAGLIDEPHSYHREDVHLLKMSKEVPAIILDIFSDLVEIINRKLTT